MTPTVRGTVHTATKASGPTTIALTIDALTQPGDLLIAHLTQQAAGQTINPPTGWTSDVHASQGANSTNIGSWLMHRVAQAGDAGTSVTFTTSNTTAMVGALAALYDADGGSFSGTLDGTPASFITGVDATTVATPTMTTALANSLVLFGVGMGKTGGGSWTPPAGSPTVTELADVSQAATTGALAWMPQATAGTVTSRTFTASGTFDTVVALVVAFAYSAPSAAAISTISDDFDDNSLDAAKWVNASTGTATLAETGGQIVITPPASTAGTNYGVLNSVNSYSLLGDNVFVQLAQPLSLGTNRDSSFYVFADASNAVGFVLQYSGSVYALKTLQRVAGVTTTPITIFSAATYNASHRWLRIRESGGTTFWDTSPDSITWTNQASAANPITLSSVKINLDAGTFGSTTSVGTLIYDNLNVANTAPTLRGTTSSGTSISSSTLALTISGSAQAGDLLLAGVAQASSGATISGPSGWTPVAMQASGGASNVKLGLWWKVCATADIGAVRNWTSTASNAMGGAVQAFADGTGLGWGTNPLDAFETFATGVDATTITPVTPSTNFAQALVVWLLAVGEGATGAAAFTPPGGTPTVTELADVASGAMAFTFAWMVQAVAGALDTRTWTVTGLSSPATFDTAAAIVAAFAPAVPASVSTGGDRSFPRGMTRGMTRGMVG